MVQRSKAIKRMLGVATMKGLGVWAASGGVLDDEDLQ